MSAIKWVVTFTHGQIADTGDYTTSCEISNGRDSLLCYDDVEDAEADAIAKALNDSGVHWHCDEAPMIDAKLEAYTFKGALTELAQRVYAFCHMNKTGGYSGDGRAPEAGSIYELCLKWGGDTPRQ